MRTVHCTRCSREATAIEGGVFYTPALETELKSNVCVDCWNEWQRAEVMVINELKLNFMDPQALPRLIAQMREFFVLDGTREAGGAGSGLSSLPPDVNLKRPVGDESE
jgi:Fe-S cluster biosynthesis and repair protein YggX